MPSIKKRDLYPIFIFSFCCVIFLGYIFYKINMPSPKEQERHLLVLCESIQANPSPSQDQLYQEMYNVHLESTPGYAYKKPKFYSSYAKSIIQHYFQLSSSEQQKAQQHLPTCIDLLK